MAVVRKCHQRKSWGRYRPRARWAHSIQSTYLTLDGSQDELVLDVEPFADLTSYGRSEESKVPIEVLAESVGCGQRLELTNIVAEQEALFSVAEILLEELIVASLELLPETPPDGEAVSKVGAQTLVDLPAPERSFLIPVDVVVRIVHDALEGSFGELELLFEGAVRFASVIGTDEPDGVDVVAEAIAQARVANVKVGGRGVVRGAHEKRQVPAFFGTVRADELAGEAIAPMRLV